MRETEKRGTQEDIYSRVLGMVRRYSEHTDRMPPEETLAAELGISRVKLRDVLAILETQGYIDRAKGVGTLINRHVLQENVRLDIDVIYEEIVEAAGFTPRTLVRKLQYLANTPAHIAERLEISPEQPVWTVEKVVYADEQPAIYLRDFILPKYYNQNDIDMRLLAKSTFSFIQNYVKNALESMVVRVDACGADDAVAAELNVAPGTPILCLETMCYGLRGNPVLCSVEYHNTKLLPYSFFKRLNRTQYYTGE